ncbi:N4-gp56 family major capsid protein [Marinomonas hwangdonensis]|uniref:N4-gp56 family major capsid protein n=1 Tax=Marinomonas hwangdonensis TaxID=1053647 RepID=A0A3M8QAB9_9GAMM|nr:N4-gp56 family major capsid protein [Marinomonas hwangdonensis]RNF52989.1 N4-gp56 family major capsid protein [Marinomonas hwangdonensis]
MKYGDISPRTAAHVSKDLLERGIPYMCLENFGQSKPLAANSTQSMTFRRYEALDPTPKVLAEGVTPTGNTLTKTDVTVQTQQFGDWIELTDVIEDTHEDPILSESTEILGEQAAEMMELIRYGALKAGSTVFYAGTGVTARANVASAISRDLQRKVTRFLKAQKAKKITKRVAASPNYGTSPVAPAYVAICHTDLEGDIRDMDGFVAVEEYGSGMTPFEGEIGKVEDVRYIASPIFAAFADAGATSSTMLSTTGTNADVYPILFLGANAYGMIPFKGKHAVTPMVVNPKPANGDPLGQRGSVGWKTRTATVILNDLWMARVEVTASV